MSTEFKEPKADAKVIERPPSSNATAGAVGPKPPLSLSSSSNSNNQRDDYGSFNEKDSNRQASSPVVVQSKKRKVTDSFDVDDNDGVTTTAASVVQQQIQPSTSTSDSSKTDSTATSSFEEEDTVVPVVVVPLKRLENVTNLSRSLIAPELFLKEKHKQNKQHTKTHTRNNKINTNNKMATPAVTSSSNNNGGKKKGIFSKRLSLRRGLGKDEKEEESTSAPTPSATRRPSGSGGTRLPPSHSPKRSNSNKNLADNAAASSPPPSEEVATTPQRSNAQRKTEQRQGRSSRSPKRGVLQRLRSVSRSRSKKGGGLEGDVPSNKPFLVAVTSCRSDAYYNQKAPGSTSKLPRKAPSNLKLFHELAVGIKDAYAAVGQTPTRPVVVEDNENEEESKKNSVAFEGKTVLWEFIGNLDFVSVLWGCACC